MRAGLTRTLPAASCKKRTGSRPVLHDAWQRGLTFSAPGPYFLALFFCLDFVPALAGFDLGAGAGLCALF